MATLRCPETGLPLRQMSLIEAERIAGPLHARLGAPSARPKQVLLRSDDKAAYPLIEDVPILMTPEMLSYGSRVFDLRDARWGEAYDEMDFYNQSALDMEQSISDRVRDLSAMRGQPVWSVSWIDGAYDGTSELEALEHLGDPEGTVLLQLGGKGVHAAKALLAGARQVWLITPMLSEALYALALADGLGVRDRLQVAVGIAEQIPLADETFDAIYAGGCLHHMATGYAAPEIYRVLKPGGRFAAIEPWQTLLHKYGTRLIGKREPNAYCSPLTMDRLQPVQDTFKNMEVRQHGPVLRYLSLALQKLTRRSIRPQTGLWLTRIDDKLPIPRRFGGSAAVLVQRP